MPPLLADFIHPRVCKPICEKSLTLPACESGPYILSLISKWYVDISIDIPLLLHIYTAYFGGPEARAIGADFAGIAQRFPLCHACPSQQGKHSADVHLRLLAGCPEHCMPPYEGGEICAQSHGISVTNSCNSITFVYLCRLAISAKLHEHIALILNTAAADI